MTMLWRLPFCLMDRHRPDRTAIVWDGTRHASRCRDCRNAVRLSGKGYWKRMAEPKGQ